MKARKIYLSRLLLDMRSRRIIAELTHPYEMHRTLMKAFPTMDGAISARSECGMLFRADADERRGVIKLYVQSCVEPDWTFLSTIDGYLLRDSAIPPYECKEVTPSLRRITEGQVLAFCLRANPTKRVGRDGDPLRGKRVELQREDEQIAWLVAKGRGGREGVPGGFELLGAQHEVDGGNPRLTPRVHVRCEGKVTGRKKGPDGDHVMTHLSVLFHGLLRVTDAAAFLETVCTGVGCAKACGFGLLSLAPVGMVSVGGRT